MLCSLQVGIYHCMRCPVQEHETAFGAGFRVDTLRADPSFRGVAWHDDISVRVYVQSEVTYGRVMFNYRLVQKQCSNIDLQALLFFSAVVGEWQTEPVTKGYVFIKWYRRHGVLSQCHGMRQLRWESGGGAYAVPNAFHTVCNAFHNVLVRHGRNRPLHSVLPMESIIKKELVVPGFGTVDEKTHFWVNQYAWISGRSTSTG
jgi:hypothetical protein